MTLAGRGRKGPPFSLGLRKTCVPVAGGGFFQQPGGGGGVLTRVTVVWRRSGVAAWPPGSFGLLEERLSTARPGV